MRIFIVCYEQIRDRLRRKSSAYAIPIGAEENFEGVVDLIRMKAIYWNEADKGMTYEETEIPEDISG